MKNISATSEPAMQSPVKVKKRKMSAAGRKAVSEASKARWAAKKEAPTEVPAIAPSVPLPPSPAVLQLQAQVVDLVSQRNAARIALNEHHNAYLLAQSRFQGAENELKGIEAEVSYRIGLIGQLENRTPSAPAGYAPQPVLQMPSGSIAGVTSEPAPKQQGSFAVGSADELRRDFRGMM